MTEQNQNKPASPLDTITLPTAPEAPAQAAPASAPAPKPMPKGLGRGLGALLDDTAAAAIAPHGPAALGQPASAAPKAERLLPIESLMPSSVQPRRTFDGDALKALSMSIQSQGIIQPLLVRPSTVEAGKYEIIGGERRWRAAKMANYKEVPVIIRQLDDGRALEVALVENVQRADLNPLEEAMGYERLVAEFSYTHEDMARVTGKSRSHITNLLRLLALPDKIKECVNNGLLTMGHARALLSLGEEPELQLRAANKVIKNQLSVRETEDLVRNLLRPGQPARGRRPADPKISALEQLMQERVGLRVAIRQQDAAGGGSVRIFFDSVDELSTLLKRLGQPGAGAPKAASRIDL
jgi:ParB family chromosome partitioning protein